MQENSENLTTVSVEFPWWGLGGTRFRCGSDVTKIECLAGRECRWIYGNSLFKMQGYDPVLGRGPHLWELYRIRGKQGQNPNEFTETSLIACFQRKEKRWVASNYGYLDCRKSFWRTQWYTGETILMEEMTPWTCFLPSRRGVVTKGTIHTQDAELFEIVLGLLVGMKFDSG